MIIKKILRHAIGSLYYLPPKFAHSIRYFCEHKSMLNWKEPQTYDEKIHILIVSMKGKDYSSYVDKYDVYKYIIDCGLADLLIPVLGVYSKPSEIEYKDLPDKFIIKATHGAGDRYYSICTCKDRLDKKAVERKLNSAIKEDFSKVACEYHYHMLKPKIMIQELLEIEGQEMLTDYKVICTDGKPRCILVCSNRDEGRDYYSTDWEYLDYVKEKYRSGKRELRPECLEQMIEAAEILSKPFPLARVDFYIVKNRLWFSEITLTPSGGNHRNLNEKGQSELGKLIILPV